MSQGDSKPSISSVNIGTIGHVGHGKTELIAAITTVLAKSYGGSARAYDEISNASEEKARGVTFKACHDEYDTPARHYSQVDCADHKDIVKSIIAGVPTLDGVILVVAATDGILPQVSCYSGLVVMTIRFGNIGTDWDYSP